MGEAKRRGTPEERAAQARAKIEALRPAQLVCGHCKTAFAQFDALDVPGLPGIDAVFGGECPGCGNDVVVFKGAPEAVAQAMIAWEKMLGADAQLGYQSSDGRHVPFEPDGAAGAVPDKPAGTLH
ncbi:hypothetical protein QO239_13545 [Cupriavidus taiwanensis]|uniref:Uncharacterized protein n=1 Tax=Cupriavidus taiwanensis TaxID=164546 RepID=A0A375C0M3_9BURK|nr:hypothetical protein [Cupriavidus taiwanensis]MDK3023622.1 hypothetical protein [Cupriavidus taiwanensis]SOY60407.1 conserved hypothetical protein [Cupriavidus taiwanensis]